MPASSDLAPLDPATEGLLDQAVAHLRGLPRGAAQ